MLFEFNFYSSVLLISFSHGIIYSFLLFKKGFRNENRSNLWLGFFVLICSLYIAPWMLGFAGWYDNQPYRDILFYSPLQHLFLIGPIIYFYTQSLLNPSFRLHKKQLLHFVPGILYLIYSLLMAVYDKLIINGYFFYKDGIDKDFDNWYQSTGLFSMVVYFVLCIRYYNRYRKLIFQISSYAESVLFTWIKNYLYAFLIMLLLPLAFDFAAFFIPKLNSYQGSWWYFLFFSVILYYIAVAGYSNATETKIPFAMSVFEKSPILLLDQNKANSTADEFTIDIDHEMLSSDQNTEIEFWKEKIASLIDSEKLYQNPELNLTDVSKKLQTNASVISKAINQGFGINFNDFINQYRVDAVKQMFENGAHKKSTLLGIGFDCGFNSKATFNRAFKKNTGFSPKEFLSQKY